MYYYEEGDDSQLYEKAGLTDSDWQAVGRLHSAVISMTCENPALAIKCTHELLRIIEDDLNDDSLKFALLVGHDTNIIMLMTALGAGDYHLPDTINSKAPIGGKIVFEKRRGSDGRIYINPYFIYQTNEQIRHRAILDLKHPPLRYGISFEGIARNEDGLYSYEDFKKLLKDISARYEYYTDVRAQ